MKRSPPKPLRRASCVGLGLLILFVPSSLLRPDAIVITKAMTATTIAEMFVEEDSILVELEIGVPDLDAFRNLVPDELYERLGHDPEPLVERVPRFFREDLTMRPDNGEPIPGRVAYVEARRRLPRDEITGELLPAPEGAGEPVVFMRLVYPLRGRPETLVIKPPRASGGQTAANIGFVTYHRNVPVNDFRYLGIAEQLNLDWDDPWYSQFNNRNLRRQYYAPISAFLYVEPFEVRKEIVFRPKDLQQWVDLGLEGKDIIPAAQWDEIKQRAAEFLAEKNPVTIDGRLAEGQLDRVHFIYRNLRTSGVLELPEDLDIISATMGVIFVYPTDGLPQEVDMEWELFTDRINQIPSSATDEAGPLPYVLSVDDNVLRWQNFLKNPTDPGALVEVQAPPARRNMPLTTVAILAVAGLIGLAVRFGRTLIRGQWPPKYALLVTAALVVVLALTGPRAVLSGRVTDDDAQSIVTALLQNTYRAFDFKDESAIYDVLARSSAGELLTDIYLETRRSLELKNQGGARVKVKEVEVLDSEAEPLDGQLGFVSHLTWNVSGSVGHWGHIHTRRNQYEARFTVKSIDGAWKLTSLELLQEQRI